MILSIFTPKIEKSISVYTEGITNLGKTLTIEYFNIEMRFQIVFSSDKSMEGADSNYVTLICL